jgi:hypothetical protein
MLKILIAVWVFVVAAVLLGLSLVFTALILSSQSALFLGGSVLLGSIALFWIGIGTLVIYVIQQIILFFGRRNDNNR